MKAFHQKELQAGGEAGDRRRRKTAPKGARGREKERTHRVGDEDAGGFLGKQCQEGGSKCRGGHGRGIAVGPSTARVRAGGASRGRRQTRTRTSPGTLSCT